MQGFCEQDIIAGCKENNPLMQKRLYEEFYNSFLKLCCRYAKDDHEAENILHDGFIKIFKNIREYEGKGSFEGWMKRIVINSCLDYLRSKSAKNLKQTTLPESLEIIQFSTKDQSAIDKLSMKEILNFIQLLPSTTRTVFNLFIFEGFSHKEISNIMNISEGTSQWHVNNARKFLQIKIKNYAK